MAADCRTPGSRCHLPQIHHFPRPVPLLRFFLLSVILIDRVLPARTLQLHRDFHLRLVDLVVFPKSLEMRRQHLHPQRTVGNPINVCPPLCVRLQLHLSLRRLSVGVAHHHEPQRRHRPFIVLSPRRPNHPEPKHDHYRHHHRNISFHMQSQSNQRHLASHHCGFCSDGLLSSAFFASP